MALFKRKKKEDKQETQVQPTEQVKVAKSQKTHKAQKAQKVEKKGNKVAFKVLIHPLITEKSTVLNSLNQYVFVVDAQANKVEIKKAIQEVYNVEPVKVRIINNLGKQRRSGRGQMTRLKNWKKAIVVLPQGSKIDVYEGV